MSRRRDRVQHALDALARYMKIEEDRALRQEVRERAGLPPGRHGNTRASFERDLEKYFEGQLTGEGEPAEPDQPQEAAQPEKNDPYSIFSKALDAAHKQACAESLSGNSLQEQDISMER